MNLNTCNIIKFPIRLAWVLPGEGDLIWDPIGGFVMVMDMALEEDDEASMKKKLMERTRRCPKTKFNTNLNNGT